VGDPQVDADNGYGLVGLHWAAFKRFWATVRTLEGWRPGEVSFDTSGRPLRVVHATTTLPAPLPAATLEGASAD
jgi:hypothetical protein